ncbi:hypothetical protein K402DRAFT_451064 [Aulographum hederae CBS 113979]|uniref:Uncharacterized protein n=1 Tax=Aulographum hederae CBS 113979 TaxID=1176131 RepID=A0A6G1HC19_9PEZI|nr:hypothetical protein K402DRAFT_451064 [Aulographum hederae CBS 113979]
MDHPFRSLLRSGPPEGEDYWESRDQLAADFDDNHLRDLEEDGDPCSSSDESEELQSSLPLEPPPPANDTTQEAGGQATEDEEVRTQYTDEEIEALTSYVQNGDFERVLDTPESNHDDEMESQEPESRPAQLVELITAPARVSPQATLAVEVVPGGAPGPGPQQTSPEIQTVDTTDSNQSQVQNETISPRSLLNGTNVPGKLISSSGPANSQDPVRIGVTPQLLMQLGAASLIVIPKLTDEQLQEYKVLDDPDTEIEEDSEDKDATKAIKKRRRRSNKTRFTPIRKKTKVRMVVSRPATVKSPKPILKKRKAETSSVTNSPRPAKKQKKLARREAQALEKAIAESTHAVTRGKKRKLTDTVTGANESEDEVMHEFQADAERKGRKAHKTGKATRGRPAKVGSRYGGR